MKNASQGRTGRENGVVLSGIRYEPPKKGMEMDMSITIDKEFEALIPPLSPDEFKQLEENCLSEGIRDALITWNGILIDGHNRFRIATKHGLHWKEEKKDFSRFTNLQRLRKTRTKERRS